MGIEIPATVEIKNTYQYEIHLSASDDMLAVLDSKEILKNSPKWKLLTDHSKVKRAGSTQGSFVDPFGNGITINQSDMHVIGEIIRYMDKKTTLALGLPPNQKHLKDEGKRIDHVHPLCFIWTIVHNHELKNKLKSFRDTSAFALKWNGFLGYSAFHDKGFGRNMEKYYNHRNPDEYMQEFECFYRALNLKDEVMNPYVTSKNWKGFTSALLDDSSYR